MTIQKIQRTQAERFSDFMADSLRHGPWIATGTVRRYLDDYAVEVAETVVRFRDGSEIQRADAGSLGTNEARNVSPHRPRQQLELD